MEYEIAGRFNIQHSLIPLVFTFSWAIFTKRVIQQGPALRLSALETMAIGHLGLVGLIARQMLLLNNVT
jgi:hypothetical protein